MTRKHEHRWSPPHRNHRHCKTCWRRQIKTRLGWRDSMTVQQFANRWLPAISGPEPRKMMQVDVAFPFEFNSYESWDVVVRVRFDFTDVVGRRQAGLGTRTDVINGWRSEWREDFCQIDADLQAYYEERTGKPYEIGDNTHEQMRRMIQA